MHWGDATGNGEGGAQIARIAQVREGKWNLFNCLIGWKETCHEAFVDTKIWSVIKITFVPEENEVHALETKKINMD